MNWPKLGRLSGTQPGTLEFGPGYQFQQDSHMKTRQNSKCVAYTGCESCKSGTRVLLVSGSRAPNDPPAWVRHNPETGQDWASSHRPLSLETYNIHVYIVVLGICFHFSWVFFPRSRISMSYGNSAFNLKSCQTVFQSSWTVMCFLQQGVRVLISSHS